MKKKKRKNLKSGYRNKINKSKMKKERDTWRRAKLVSKKGHERLMISELRRRQSLVQLLSVLRDLSFLLHNLTLPTYSLLAKLFIRFLGTKT